MSTDTLSQENLTEKTCTPCRGGMPPLEPERAGELLKQVPNWELENEATWLKRTFRFDNFRQALDFAKQVGELAEQEGHHPIVQFGWGFCKIELRTFKIDGLHENDFILAAKIDQLLQ